MLGHLPSFGRATSQNSHRFAKGKVRKNLRFQIPTTAQDLFDTDKATVLELRGDKLQPMVPPSVHPNGELLRWTGFEPISAYRFGQRSLHVRAR